MDAQNRKPRITSSLLVWGVADLFFVLSVTVAISFGILLPSLQKQLSLSTIQLGLLGFAFFLSFGAMQFWTGSLIDAKGPKATLTASALAAAAGLFLLSYADSFIGAMIAQVLTGMGFSIAYVGAIYLAHMWFSKKLFPVVSGITQMSANIISSIALFCMALSGAIAIDVHTIAMRLAFLALVVALLSAFFVRTSESRDKTLTKKPLSRRELCKLFCLPQFWLGVVYFGTNFGAFLAFSSLWNIPDSLSFGHSLETATMMSATLRFGGAFGAVVSGILARRLKRCSTVVKWYSTGTFALAAFLVYGPAFPTFLTFIIMGLLGFFSGGTALGFPLLAEHIPPAFKGAGFGFMTSLGYLLCAFFEYLVGSILSSSHIFAIALTPLVISLLIGWVCSLNLREKHSI